MLKNEEIVYELVIDMIKKGHKKIGYVSGSPNSFDNLHRFKGLVKALTEHNLSTEYYYKGDFTKESGYIVGKKLIESKDTLPDFIFCANDEMAIGMMDAFKEQNIKIPEDVAVAGFDNIELSNYYSPRLTTIDVEHLSWGRELSKALIN